jgi:hypothetical protein
MLCTPNKEIAAALVMLDYGGCELKHTRATAIFKLNPKLKNT